MKPPLVFSAVPSDRRPRPLMCECAAVRFSRPLPLTSLIWTGAIANDDGVTCLGGLRTSGGVRSEELG